MKIKTSLIYSIAAGALLCAGSANAQSATDPVGFHTLTVFGKTGDSNRFSLISPGLVNAIDFAGATTSITDTTVTVDGTPFEGLDFGGGAYYVEATDGPEAGAWATITANDDSTLTVDRDLSAAGAAKIAIRKHVTIGDLFGPNNEAGLREGLSLSEADEVSIFTNGISTKYWFTPADGGFPASWVNEAFEDTTNVVIEPQQGVYVERAIAGDVSFTRSGHVKVGPTKLNISGGVYNIVANPRAVGSDDNSNPVFTLGNSNLFDAADPANSVVGGNSIEEADEFSYQKDDGSFEVAFWAFAGGGAPAGWVDGAFNPLDDFVIDNGHAFLLNRKAPGASFIWTVPAETIAE